MFLFIYLSEAVDKWLVHGLYQKTCKESIDIYIYIYTSLSTPKIHKLRGCIWHVFMCSLHPSGGTHCGCIRSGAHMRKPNWLMISSGSVREPLPPGNLAQLLTVAIFNGKIHYEQPCSIAMLNQQSVSFFVIPSKCRRICKQTEKKGRCNPEMMLVAA